MFYEAAESHTYRRLYIGPGTPTRILGSFLSRSTRTVRSGAGREHTDDFRERLASRTQQLEIDFAVRLSDCADLPFRSIKILTFSLRGPLFYKTKEALIERVLEHNEVERICCRLSTSTFIANGDLWSRLHTLLKTAKITFIVRFELLRSARKHPLHRWSRSLTDVRLIFYDDNLYEFSISKLISTLSVLCRDTKVRYEIVLYAGRNQVTRTEFEAGISRHVSSQPEEKRCTFVFVDFETYLEGEGRLELPRDILKQWDKMMAKEVFERRSVITA